MPFQPFVISGYRTGLETEVAPWLLPQDAFQTIQNGYLRHGQIRKRAGYQIFGTLSNGTQVTGIYNFVLSDGSKEIIATDTTDTYRYNTGTMVFDQIPMGPYFTNNNYTWFANFGISGLTINNTLYITNNEDNIYSYQQGAGSLTTFVPQYGSLGTDVVATCLMIFFFKGRLLLLNTWEGNSTKASAQQRPQRIRWSQRRDPNVWDQNTPGGGGFLDLSTGDSIVSARILQDTLIIFCTNSTWALRATTDPAFPFRPEKINSFRSTGSTFGSIAHDRYIISFGETGIIACDGIEVQRIDQRIEDFVSDEINTDLFPKLYSTRDYITQRSWTLYPPSSEINADDQNLRALIRMEDTGSYSIYKIPLSTIGTGETSMDLAFDDFVAPDRDWAFGDPEVGDATFQSYYQQLLSDILLGGDYEGSIYILEVGSDDAGSDIDFSLTSGAWNPFSSDGLECELGWVDIYADSDPNTTLTIQFFINDENAPYTTQEVALVNQSTFLDKVSFVNQSNPAVVTSVDHGLSTGDEIYISGVLGMVGINGGPYTITVIDEDSFSLAGIDSSAFSAYTSGGIITEISPEVSLRTWVRVYAGGIGRLHYMNISTSGTNQNIVIHSLTPYFRSVGGRLIS